MKSNKIYKVVLIVVLLTLLISSVFNIVKFNGNIKNIPGSSISYMDIDSFQKGIFNGLIYFLLMVLLFFSYYKIVKNEDYSNKNIFKSGLIFIGIISFITIFIIPNNSSDIYLYMASGRLDGKYHQDISTYMFADLQRKYPNDEIIQISSKWNLKFSYGALFKLICKVLGMIPVNSVLGSLIMYKILFVIFHILNCYILYKISKDMKIVLAYGLNPLVIFEGLINAHNDIIMLFFMLIAIYFKKENKKHFAILSIALGVMIKFVPILLLPYVIIDKKIKLKDLGKYILNLLECLSIVIALSYIIDPKTNFFIFSQQNLMIANSWHLLYFMFFGNYMKVKFVSNAIKYFSQGIFITYFTYSCLKYNNPKKYFICLLLFLILFITNFRQWYIIWTFAFLPILDNDDKNTIIKLSLSTEFSNIFFYLFGSFYIWGIPFFILNFIIFGVLIAFQKYNIFDGKKESILKKIKRKNMKFERTYKDA